MDKEKRRKSRKQLIYYVKVFHDNESGELAGYLGDISTSGLMLFSEKKNKKNQVLMFRVDMQKEFGMDEDLVFKARSLWCEKDVNPDYYMVGYEFVDLDQASVDIVSYLVKKYGFDQS